jgi:hypothetical protein
MAVYPEPTWSISEDRDVLSSIFLEQPVSPTTITAFLIRLVQCHFIAADHIFNPSIKGLLWNDDETLSKIFIGAGYSQNDKVAGQKPGIFVIRSEVSSSNIYLPAHIATVSVGGAAPQYPVHNRLLTGGHMLLIKSRSGAEAEAIGEELTRLLLGFAPVIIEDTHLRMFDLTKVSAIEKQESGDYALAVNTTWSADFFFRNPDETAW